MILDSINSPSDLKALSLAECDQLAGEIRDFIVETVSRTGGHLGSNLGVVELTLALHRVFNSPEDIILFDTGHQAYIHKLVTGRREGFARLKQEGGLSGYPSRAESAHDWVENSHASTALSYAHGIATGLRCGSGEPADGERHVVAVVGDGALTGGMAYEALNNLGHSGARVLIVLNDNGRSYAPTVSRLSVSLTQLRLDPRYLQVRERVRHLVEDLPGGVSSLAFTSFHGLSAAVREVVEPRMFFEALGIRYTGPIDGHDIGVLEQSLRRAASWHGPIVLHVVTTKGKGYAPAEADDIACLHDMKLRPAASPARSAGARRLVRRAAGRRCQRTLDRRRRAARAARRRGELRRGLLRPSWSSPPATSASWRSQPPCPARRGCSPSRTTIPERFVDVGIAEQHAMTAAAGMAMGGLRPVVAIYSTFLAQGRRPVEPRRRAARPAGRDLRRPGRDHRRRRAEPPRHLRPRPGAPDPGLRDLLPGRDRRDRPDAGRGAQARRAVLAPVPEDALSRPACRPGTGLKSRRLRTGTGEVVLVGIGKMTRAVLAAADELVDDGIETDVFDARVVRPADPELLEAMARAGSSSPPRTGSATAAPAPTSSARPSASPTPALWSGHARSCSACRRSTCPTPSPTPSWPGSASTPPASRTPRAGRSHGAGA